MTWNLQHLLFVAYFISKLAMSNQQDDTGHQNSAGNPYDFIVVGGGSAGSVIASRLSEVPEWRVLLLEAGRRENFFSLIPLFVAALYPTHYNWQYLTERQEGFGLGIQDQRLAWTRGKALGGSSVVNYMIYSRGHPRDYDRWAQLGNPGWSYKDVLPYFLKSEMADLKQGDPAYHNKTGYLSVEDSFQSHLVDTFIEAGTKLGYKNVDYCTQNVFGFSTVQATTHKGRRHSVARAFIYPVLQRKNLNVITSAHVTKVLINETTKNAYGVEYIRGNKLYRALASKEVILSAGVFNSAQLLMLSGVGPKQHLDELQIPVIQDLPVGKNLNDHLTFVGIVFTMNKTTAYRPDVVLNPSTLRTWFNGNKGVMASIGGVEGIAFIKTNASKEKEDHPDIELMFMGGSLNTDYGITIGPSMRVRQDVYNEVWRPIERVPTWTVFPLLLYPKSSGYLKLRSKNPLDPPELHGGYYTDPEGDDLNTMVSALRFVIEMSKTEPFQKIGSKLHDIPIPTCKQYQFNSDEYWKCALKSVGVTIYHQMGTCKMGPADDMSSVVSSELKVYGVGRLRVADASVIPQPISAHTNAPCVMIGEKAADFIKRAWKV